MRTLAILPPVETPNLVVREMEARDIPFFVGFMTQDAYQRHIAIRLKDEHEVRAFVNRSLVRQGDERRHVYHLAAEEKVSGEAIGDGFLILQREGLVEIGWGVHPAMWGMGLGSEIAAALAGLAFERLGAARLWCKVMAVNRASVRVARSIGMRHLRSHADYPAGTGRFEPVEIYGLASKEYFERSY